MTDQTNTQTNEDSAPVEMTELAMLKQRATLMGVPYSNNIKIDTLRERINAKLAGEKPSEDDTDQVDDDDLVDPPVEVPAALQTTAEAAPAPLAPEPVAAPVAAAPEPAPAPQPVVSAPVAPVAEAPAPVRRMTRAESEAAIRQKLIKDEMKLLRLRITNMDPKKADLPGEIITVANEYIGTVRKFIPYGEVTDNGFHVPKCIYDQLVDREFQSIRTKKNARTGSEMVETRMAREFAIEILPQLTQAELDQLAMAQVAAGSLDS